MKPEKWGPYIWYLMHIIAYHIPDNEYFIKYKSHYIKFYEILKKIIPCPICRSHYNKMLMKNDLKNCDTKEKLINWTINKHNKVNKRLKKKTYSKNEIDIYYKNIDINNLLISIDILALNYQRIIPINEYFIMYNLFKIILPIHLRDKYIKIIKKK